MTRARILLHVSLAILVVLLVVFSNRPALAHGGGIDAYGGHNDNRMGNYHAHGGVSCWRYSDRSCTMP